MGSGSDFKSRGTASNLRGLKGDPTTHENLTRDYTQRVWKQADGSPG